MPRRIARAYAAFLTRLQVGEGEGLPIADELPGTVQVQDLGNITAPERTVLAYVYWAIPPFAAVFGTFNLQATTAPIRVIGFSLAAPAVWGIRANAAAPLITANLATQAPTQTLGGVSQALISTGTAAAFNAFRMADGATVDTLKWQPLEHVILHPGEIWYAQDSVANDVFAGAVGWTEWPEAES